jgi:hypothetical protein
MCIELPNPDINSVHSPYTENYVIEKKASCNQSEPSQNSFQLAAMQWFMTMLMIVDASNK